MVRAFSVAARLGLAITLALLALAASRWEPVAAEAPLDVRALPLALPALLLATLGALTGRERRPTRWRAAALALLAACGALALVVLARGPAGIAAEVGAPGSVVARTTAAPIDLTGRDLRQLAAARQVSVRWAGELRVPVAGAYALRLEGRGRASLALDGRTLFEAEGDPLAARVVTALARGGHALEVRLAAPAAGARLRLVWTRPDGGSETVPARWLGPPRPTWLWRLSDVLALAVAALLGAVVWLAPWERPRQLGPSRPLTVSELGVAAAGLLALLAVMSWPLATDLAHSGPMDRPDGRLNAWILAWAGETAWTQPSRLFQAPAFHPLPDALAFSENLLLPALVVAPLQRLSGPVLAYNVALLGSLLLSGLATYALVRRVSGDRLAAFVAGACFAASPQRWTRLSHLHAQLTVFLPLALLALDRFWERRSLARALLIGVALALQGLASIYLGAITAATLAVAVAVALFAGLRPRELGRLAAGFLLAALVLWPVLRPYLRMRELQGQEFTLETVSVYAASLPSYAAAGTAAWGWLTQRLLDPADVRDTLFPGLGVLLLGLAGLASAPRRYRAVAVAASVVAVVFSLGPDTAFYRFLHEHVVLVRGIRALARFALVPQLALSVLTGLALAGRRRVSVLLALALVLVESANLPLRLERYTGPSPAARSLAGRKGAVLVLPLAVDDTRAMLDGLVHGRPLVNGDSGFIPRPFDRAMELFAHGADAEGLRFLRAVGVTQIVERDEVREVPPGEKARLVAAGEPVATRFAREGIVVAWTEPRRVARVAFELSDGEWLAAPRVAASLDGVVWEPVAATASLADATLSLYADPRHARGELRFAPRNARFLRLDPRLAGRASAFEIGP